MDANDLFNNNDPFGLPQPETGTNAPPEYSVSELSHKLKRMVEEGFSYVRVRGEISKVTIAKSGHLYTALKDAEAVLDAVCWKGTVARLGVKPEEGMEVICTGRLTTYPGRSNYQLIIETMELAGQGALLKMLEERRKKLAAEGLFDAARKKPLPFLPETIGVITSPTGAVIRDILHRLDERFPRRVLLWPVMVQGQTAAAQVIAAINGFNALPVGSKHRPDLLIVARGGGSLEDLMPFNDEALVRAVAASVIPIISAVGHETDTTLIDYAADLRAPTPTAAAEKAVPVRAELLLQVMDDERRMVSGAQRFLQQHRVHIQGLGRGLGDPKRLMEAAMQRLDHLSSKLDLGLQNWLHRRSAKLNELAAKLSPQNLTRQVSDHLRILLGVKERLAHIEKKILRDRTIKLQNLSDMLESLSFKRVLERGYAVIKDSKGEILSSIKSVSSGQNIHIELKDGTTEATVKK
jgi:exodeoxyribonuclease VII large subunit